MPIPQSIVERIATFGRNLDSYLDPDYKEAQVRQEFIDPFFAALGWDVPGVKQLIYGLALFFVVVFLPNGIWPALARKLKVSK